MNAARWPFSRALLVLLLLEGAYMIGTRWLMGMGDVNGIGIELARTILRLISAAAVWGILGGILEKPTKGAWRGGIWWLLPLLATCLMFLVPLIAGNWNLPEADTRLVFAITSLAVGMREELVYRGILQTLLEKKLGLLWAIVITSVAFALYHYGAQPWNWFTVTQYLCFGVFFGVLYARTRSLWLVIWIHTLYDALWCYTPFIANPWNVQRSIPFLLSAALLTITWLIFSRKKVSA
ncbi:MAG: CPBP family intramembrane glutamic endopeptidase [Puniceicoccales bacterium]